MTHDTFDHPLISPDAADRADHLRQLTADVVAAYVANNSVRPGELSDLIAGVHAALAGLDKPAPVAPPPPEPAVPIKKSVFADHLVSLIDGKSYKSLKRHLGTHGLTPDDYRARYGLWPDYPMVCADYSKVRSKLAKDIGLGNISNKPAEVA